MTDETNETGEQQAKAGMNGNIPPKSKRFGQPGGNPINKKGVPKDAIALRKLVKKMGGEIVPGSDLSRLELLLRGMYASKAPADKQSLIKIGWPGALVDNVDLTSDGKAIQPLIVKVGVDPDKL